MDYDTIRCFLDTFTRFALGEIQSMRTSRAAIFQGVGLPWRLADAPIPDLRPDEILVKISACTICGSDVHSIDGRRSVPTPSILGHEIVGEIAAFGSSDPMRDARGEELQIGDRVVWSVVVSCGHCFFCGRGLPQKCEQAFKYGHAACSSQSPLSGGYAEFIVLQPGTSVVRIPPTMSLEAACPLSCATSTIAAAMRLLQFQKEETVLILGAGMLGLTACAMAKERGARTVACVDLSAARAERARSFGADTIHFEERSLPSILPPDQPHGYDVVVECTGSNEATRLGLDAVRIGGRLGLVGAVFPGTPFPIAMERLVRRQISIHGIHNYAPEDLVAAVTFMEHAERRYPFAQLVGPQFSLDAIEDAIHAARQPQHVRVCVRPSVL